MADGDEEAGQSGAPEPKREAADIISLIVRDQQGSEVMFKVKPHTKLQKVSPITHVRHMPGPLFGSCPDRHQPAVLTPALTSSGTAAEFRKQWDWVSELAACMQVKAAYCTKKNLKANTVRCAWPHVRSMLAWPPLCALHWHTLSLLCRFLFDGARIEDDNTPTSLHMEEGDRIDCVVEQIGGGGHSRERPVPAAKILL
ncbi:ubiquitin-like domain-containing protein [Haematococcus lacustris]|uniref:Ubiquitin-like domain-containing protein n=1 Tax=Haematococcus lacustris TaxID=44745 RepID=A0A699ZMI0_HAELA|nr:ubiquitin-like domain-containing protein [Haematococcus lacustris]